MILTDKKYQEALALLKKEREADPMLAAFRQWAKENYGIEVLDMEFKGKPGLKRLNILLTMHEDMHRIGACGADGDIAVRQAMVEKFRELCRQFALADYSEQDKIYIAFGDMETEIKSHVLQQAKNELCAAAEHFPDAGIVNIYPFANVVHIFYEDEAKRRENAGNGTDSALSEYCRNIIAAYDDMLMFAEGPFLNFSSQELLKEKYNNNIFDYLANAPVGHCH